MVQVLAVLDAKDNLIRDLESEVGKLQAELETKSGECERLNEFKLHLENDNHVITERVREIELLVSDREHSANLKQQNTQQVGELMQPVQQFVTSFVLTLNLKSLCFMMLFSTQGDHLVS